MSPTIISISQEKPTGFFPMSSMHNSLRYDARFSARILSERKKGRKVEEKITSDAGSQYRCGRVGRGIQPPSTPKPTPNTQTYTKSIKNARFPTFQLDDHGPTDRRTDGPTDRRTDWPTDRPTDGPTDKASYRVTCPQLKMRTGWWS